MRIAFYAPLKPPDHPVPSGDREMARLLMRALRGGGHEVTVASRLRAFDGSGSAARQERLRQTGARLARRYILHNRDAPPDAWFTYHLYHKAADWIGPAVADALGIPYLVAEASYAPKQEGGPWSPGHSGVKAALRTAARVICLNPVDAECIATLLGDSSRLVQLQPFTDIGPGRKAALKRSALREVLSTDLGLDPGAPWIAVTAMMRRGDKLASYRLLGSALRQIADHRWKLLVAGDGEARKDVERSLDFPDRVRFLDILEREDLDRLHAAADIGAWPAINEAFGMALLEAQAAGLPIVAGDRPGVRQIVRDGVTGLLAPEGDRAAFAAAVAGLLGEPGRVAKMRQEALATAARQHSLESASIQLNAILRDATGAVTGCA